MFVLFKHICVIVATAHVDLKYATIGSGTLVYATTGARLGSHPGISHTFVVDFGYDAKTVLGYNNGHGSKYWTEINETYVSDLLVTSTTVKRAYFEYDPGVQSKIAFYDFARSHKNGAYFCHDKIDTGKPPHRCTLGGNYVEAPCNADGCAFEAEIEHYPEAVVRIQPSISVVKCTLNTTIKSTGRKLCVTPTGTTVKSASGKPVHVYETGIGGDYTLSFWSDGNSKARLYFPRDAEDPVEQLMIVLAIIITFAVWIEQTLTLTPYALNVAIRKKLGYMPKPKSKPNVKPSTLSPRRSNTATKTDNYGDLTALFERESLMPVIYAGALSGVATSTTFLVYRLGQSILHERTDDLNPYATTLVVILQCAYAWLAATSLWVLVVMPKNSTKFAKLMAVETTRASGLLMVRSLFEVSCLMAFHTHIPKEELGTLAELVGFFMGGTIVIITSRDLYIIAHIKKLPIVGVCVAMWIISAHHALITMVYPVISKSTGTLTYQNGGLVFSTALLIQCVFVGIYKPHKILK